MKCERCKKALGVSLQSAVSKLIILFATSGTQHEYGPYCDGCWLELWRFLHKVEPVTAAQPLNYAISSSSSVPLAG
jgi:hypothetical protein